MKPSSKRGKRWQEFSTLVLSHIETYTVPQYGDYPKDQLTKFSSHDIIQNIKRYLNRKNKNARGFQSELLDCIKIAHYSAELYFKFEEERRKHIDDVLENKSQAS